MTAPRDQRDHIVGLDVGSTTVKAVVVRAGRPEILWRDYRRHETRQPETVLQFLERIENELDLPPERLRVFLTGSGGSNLCRHIGAKFVQEVTAVSLAVEKLHPEASSVVELGGQDAKIIIFKESPGSDRKKKIPSMNDKCAGGTGAVIDKINAKLRIPAEELCRQSYYGIKLHHVAGKCGVFAETDINGLQKQGVPTRELMASLFESIVQQNLSVLTRGHTLRPVVLLLGGPNTFIQGMAEAWRYNIPIIWQEREIVVPDRPIEELIAVPPDAQYFAAIGAAEFGLQEDPDTGLYTGRSGLQQYIEVGRLEEKLGRASRGLAKDPQELADFRERFRTIPWSPARFHPGEVVRGMIGLDGGSTSTKAVLMSPEKELLAKAYQLSRGNPIEDTVQVFGALRRQVEDSGATLEILGVGTTGYAKDVLKDALAADVALVETVAHTMSALHYYKDVDVICDVGGQDIKIIILHKGQVRLQAEYPVLRRQRLFPAEHGGVLRPPGARVRGHRLRGPGHARVRLRLRGFHAVGHRRLPEAGMARRGDHGRAGQRAAEEHLALRQPDPQPRQARAQFRPPGRDPAQPGGGQGPGGLHRGALPGQGGDGQRLRPPAHRRVRRHRFRARGDPPVP